MARTIGLVNMGEGGISTHAAVKQTMPFALAQ